MKVFTDGNVLTGDDCEQWLHPAAKFRTSNTAQNKTTTMVPDDTLFLPLQANAAYTFRLFVIFSGSTTSGFKWSFTVPSGTVGSMSGLWDNGVHIPYAQITDVLSATIGVSLTFYVCMMNGIVVTGGTAGNLQLQYAENASDATTGAALASRSHIIAERI